MKNKDSKRDASASFNSIKTNVDFLKRQLNLSTKDLLQLLEKEVYFIPLSIFSEKLSSLETIIKYLKENICLSFSKIAFVLNRDPRAIWASYSFAQKKSKGKFENIHSGFYILTSILTNRKLSVLESIVAYLKNNYGLSYHKIAFLLRRNDRTIWTIYQRAKKKNAK